MTNQELNDILTDLVIIWRSKLPNMKFSLLFDATFNVSIRFLCEKTLIRLTLFFSYIFNFKRSIQTAKDQERVLTHCKEGTYKRM